MGVRRWGRKVSKLPLLFCSVFLSIVQHQGGIQRDKQAKRPTRPPSLAADPSPGPSALAFELARLTFRVQGMGPTGHHSPSTPADFGRRSGFIPGLESQAKAQGYPKDGIRAGSVSLPLTLAVHMADTAWADPSRAQNGERWTAGAAGNRAGRSSGPKPHSPSASRDLLWKCPSLWPLV